MRDLPNVRLHLVGHADTQPLSPALEGVFGDNQGLSHERAGEVAEFIATALALPPEAISFDWAGDTQPIASNATEAGRAQNRRVEVEVWYDQMEAKTGLEDVVVHEEIKRVKICRTETVCKLTYQEGQAKRARVKNLIPPLHAGEENVQVPQEFVRQIGQALHDLRDKQHVTVRFIGYTDDAPLAGRAERIYGTHLAVSKALSHRVALAVKDALNLPTAAIESDGRGATEADRVEPDRPRPRAEPPRRGGVLVRRPARGSAGRAADLPGWGRRRARDQGLRSALGPDRAAAARRPRRGPGAGGLRRRAAPRARRRGRQDPSAAALRSATRATSGSIAAPRWCTATTSVSPPRARAARWTSSRPSPCSRTAQAEHEGRGYVQSDDVVNAGFVQGESSYVVVQVVYDELAALDDYEGVQVTPITRELTPKDPLALNLMRITVDGEPIDDPGRSLADIQRCTDVALDDAEIQFGFDDLKAVPRLSVTADPIAAPVPADGGEGAAASPVQLPELHELRALDRSLGGADLREGPVRAGRAARGGPGRRAGQRAVAARRGVVRVAGARAPVRAARLRQRRASSTRPSRSRCG